MPAAPRITVLMSVYNGAPYLRESIDSILAQTYRDVQFVIVDDGSTDASLSIIRSYRDPRMLVIAQANQGLAAGLNRGLREAAGAFIARQDQDDVSLPGRLAAQLAYLDAHPRVGVVGTSVIRLHADGRPFGVVRGPSASLLLQWRLLFLNPFVHSSVMIRRAALDDVGAYTTDPSRQPPEDYELWSRLAQRWELGMVPRRLHCYREATGGMVASASAFYRNGARISLENLRRLGVSLPVPRLERAFEVVRGMRHPAHPREAADAIADLRVIERAFIRWHQLPPAAQLRLRLYTRPRWVKQRLLWAWAGDTQRKAAEQAQAAYGATHASAER